MNLLVVGHAFILAYIQKKYAAMKQLDPSLQIRMVVPSRMKDRFHEKDYEVHPAFAPNELVPLKALLAGWQAHMTYVHNPNALAKVMREFQPDVIHIEEEPQALITLEMIVLSSMMAPKAKVTLFTWDNLLRKRSILMDSIKRKARRYSLARTATVICGNQRSAELLRKEALFKGMIHILPHSGLDMADHQPGTEPQLRSKLGLEGGVVVGYVGRLVPEKGLRLLVDALGGVASLRWKLLLVGAGSLEPEIRDQWMKRLPGRIVLMPAVPYSQVAQHLRCVDLFVLPSYSTPTWMEQFGITLAQAMLLGIAAIGSSSGAIPEVLGPGGIVFSEGSEQELSLALRRLLTSASLRQQYGLAGRAFALKKYTSETVAAAYLAAFKEAWLAPGEKIGCAAATNSRRHETMLARDHGKPT